MILAYTVDGESRAQHLKLSDFSDYFLFSKDTSSGSNRYWPVGTGAAYSSLSLSTSGTCPSIDGTSSVNVSSLIQTARIDHAFSNDEAESYYEPLAKARLDSTATLLASFTGTNEHNVYIPLNSNAGLTLFVENGSNFGVKFNPYGGLAQYTLVYNFSTIPSIYVYACLYDTDPIRLGFTFFANYHAAGTGSYVFFLDLAYQQNYSSALYNSIDLASGFESPSGADDPEDTSGGLGDYEFPSSDIDDSDDLPASSSALYTGLINPYYVTASELASLGTFLWSSDFFDSIAKTFSNPMDCIISLSSFPIASSSMSLGSSESVRVGNTTSASTGTRLISEFVTIDCGSVSVPEVWGSYLDYAQTKLYIYIPYLGIEELPLCECMGGSVACKLRINLLTGALVACLTLTSGTYVTGSARKQPIYFSTTCKSDIPVSGATTGALAGAFQLLGGAVSTVAGIASGTAPVAVAGLASAAQGVATMQSQNSQISGAVGAAGGQMAHKIPFLIFDRPVQSVPANLASVAGYQSNSGTTLSRCSGYVICDTINLDGLALTRSELEEVEQICTSGVYIS